MAETFNKMKIDVNEEINDIITEVQGDQNSRYLDVYLYNNGVPIDLTDHTVRIYMCRPKTDPLEEIFNDGEITDATAGRCQFLLTTQALAKVGYLEMQITVWNGTEQILSTHAFKIMVTKNLMSDGSVEASNEYGALVILFQNLYEAMDLMTEMVQNIGVPAKVADKYDLTTMWQCWEFMVAYLKGDLTDKIDEAIANASVQGVLDLIGTTVDDAEDGTILGFLQELSEGVEPNFRSPIAITAGGFANTNGGLVLEGTGSGELFISVGQYDILTAVIDGVTITTSELYGSTYFDFKLEFKESFSISSVNAGGGAYATCSCVAVFY